MSIQKRLVSAALCLCVLWGLLPMRAQAAPEGVYPEVTITTGKVHKEAVGKKEISQTTYTPGKQDSGSSGKSTVTKTDKGQRLRFETVLNKLSELYFVPFTTSLTVPAHTTCTVEQTFQLSGAKQITTNNAATSAASFQLLYFGEEAPSGVTVTARTQKNGNYGASAGEMLFQGSRKGKSNKDNGDYNTERKINLEGCGNTATRKLVYKNTTAKEKTISYHFAFWGCTQYGSTYDNRFLVEFTTRYKVTSTEKVILAPTGGVVSLTEKTVTYGESYGSLPTPTRKGYTFDGWYTAKTGGEKITSASKVTTFGSHPLYAHWTPRQYTVTFDPTGGTVTPQSKTVTYDSRYDSLPTPTRTGYNFNGWYTAKAGGTKVTTETKVTATANHTLYAHWYLKPAMAPYDIHLTEDQTIVYGQDPAFSLGYGSTVDHTCTTAWYECDENGNNGKLTDTKRPDAGVHYYYAIVTAKRKDNGLTAAAKSSVAKVTVTKATPTISLKPTASVLDLAKGTALSGSTLTGGKAKNNKADIEVPGRFVWKNGATTVTKTGWQSYAVVFEPTDTKNYNKAETTVSVQVVRTNTVTVTWGELAFTYEDGTWNPRTHAYVGGGWKANSTGGDRITVKNEGTNTVTVTCTYKKSDAAIEGNLSSSTGSLAAGSTRTVTLSLTGKPTRSLANTKIGTVTVRLGGGT